MKLQGRKKAAGFSLLELSMVVAMISVVGSMSVISLRGAQGITTLISARREVMGVLEVARAESVKRDITTQVTLQSSGTYTLQYSITGTTATAPHALPVGVSFQLPTGVTSLVATYTPSGKATMKGNDGILYSQFNFVSSAGVKSLTLSRAGDIDGTF